MSDFGMLRAEGFGSDVEFSQTEETWRPPISSDLQATQTSQDFKKQWVQFVVDIKSGSFSWFYNI